MRLTASRGIRSPVELFFVYTVGFRRRRGWRTRPVETREIRISADAPFMVRECSLYFSDESAADRQAFLQSSSVSIDTEKWKCRLPPLCLWPPRSQDLHGYSYSQLVYPEVEIRQRSVVRLTLTGAAFKLAAPLAATIALVGVKRFRRGIARKEVSQ